LNMHLYSCILWHQYPTYARAQGKRKTVTRRGRYCMVQWTLCNVHVSLVKSWRRSAAYGIWTLS
jgi:hypothetical protein